MYCFSTLAEFSALRESIRQDLAQAVDQEAFGLFIAINEAVNNAIFHGNKHDISKKVYLTLDSLPDEIRIIIRDEGNGYSIPENSVEEDTLSEHGRGLQIIAHCVDCYYFNSQRNEITLIKKRTLA